MKIFCNKNNKLFIIFCGQGRNRTYIYVISDNYNEKFCCCKKLYVSKNQYFNLSKLVAGVGIEPVDPITEVGCLANSWFKPLTQPYEKKILKNEA